MASNLREFLQLAQSFDGSQNIAGWYASTKLDGCRAYYDGGITRGMYAKDVPWANVERDARYVTLPRATGLWTRYGKPIQAPSWFLDQLPGVGLDGELWMGPKTFQRLRSTISTLVPGTEWQCVRYHVFDAPSYREVFANGEIRIKGKYEKVFSGFDQWAIERAKTKDPLFLRTGKSFDQCYRLLQRLLGGRDHVSVLEQRELPWKPAEAKERVWKLAESEVNAGGEGMMVRMGGSFWVPKRVRTILKVKPWQDDEGTVIGYYWGRETELGSKLLGLMGAVIIKWKGKTFKLSGFTDEERMMLTTDDAAQEGYLCPGEVVSEKCYNPLFRRGTSITFQYRELSDDGIPKEARYLRVRGDL
jgi:DNA ligase-1